jgi:predicted neuraminidase
MSKKPPRVLFQPGPQYADENRCFGYVSSIARTPGGRLWCGFTSGGEGEGNLNHGLVVYSDDDGRTWTPPHIVLAAEGVDHIRTDHIVVWTAPSGELWLFWSQYPLGLNGFHSSQWVSVCSNPDAIDRHWSAPRQIAEGQHFLTTPTVRADGTWIFPTGCWILDGEEITKPRIKHPSRPLLTSDGGRTFELGGAFLPAAGTDYDEYMVIERGDGGLVALNRHRTSILRCESRNGGRSWTEQQPLGMPHTNSRFVFLKLQSGAWLLVKHGTLDWVSDLVERYDNRGRSHLTAYLSFDEGQSWQGGLLLEERDCSYPFGMQDQAGTIYVSYERQRWNQPEILFARFIEADVLAGQPTSPQSAFRQLINKAQGIAPSP